MNIHLNFWSKFVLTTLIVLALGALLTFAVLLSPVALSSSGSAAPVIAVGTSTLSPEMLCAKAFPSRLDTSIPAEKRAFDEAEYQKCVQARKAAVVAPQTPNFSVRPRPKAPFSAGSTAVVPRTPAGAGTILEDSASPLGPFYVIQNSWVFEISGRTYQVYAGAKREEGPPQPPNTMQGIVVVWVWGKEGITLPDGGYYYTPVKKGSVRIVGAQSQRLILKSDDGTTFYFDFPSRRFVSSLTEIVPTITPLAGPTLKPYP